MSCWICRRCAAFHYRRPLVHQIKTFFWGRNSSRLASCREESSFCQRSIFWKRDLFGTSCLWETGKQAGTNIKGLYRQKRDIRKRNVFNKQQSQSTRKIIDAGAPLSPVSRQNDARISAKVRASCLPNVYPPGALALQGLRAFSPHRSGPPVYRDVYPA